MTAPQDPIRSSRTPDDRSPSRPRRLGPGGPVVAVGAGAVAALAVTALVLVPSASSSSDDARRVADGSPAVPTTLEPSWATGSVVHVGMAQVDVGHTVTAYVRTSEGLVTVDTVGRVWSVVDGQVDQVGLTDVDDAGLVSDPRSPWAAWVDGSGTPAFVVVDQVVGTTTEHDVASLYDGDLDQAHVVDDGQGPAHAYGIDGDDLYVRAGDRALAIELAADDADSTRVVNPEVRQLDYMVDVAAGQLAWVTWDDDPLEVAIGPAWDRRGTRFAVDSSGGPLLAPDARYLAFREDDGPIYDTATGEPVELRIRRYYEPVEWLDATTLLAFGNAGPRGDGTVQLLTCDLVTRGCTVVVRDTGTSPGRGHTVVPDGDS